MLFRGIAIGCLLAVMAVSPITACAQDLKGLLKLIPAQKKKEEEKQAPATARPPAQDQSQQVREAKAPAQAQTCAGPIQPPMNEGDAVFNEAKCSGLTDEDASAYRSLLPNVKAMHDALARESGEFSFKGLKIGSEFQIKSMPSEQGNTVEWLSGVSFDFTSPPDRIDIFGKGSSDHWVCVIPKKWATNTSCHVQKPNKFATAFGAQLSALSISISSPVYIGPSALKDLDSIPWRIGGMILKSFDGAMFEPAKSYLQSKTNQSPKLKDSRRSLAPTQESCAAVRKKKISELTSHDVDLKKACDNPAAELFRGTEAANTEFIYGECCSVTRNTLRGTILMGIISSEFLATGNSPAVKARIEAMQQEYQRQRANRQIKDF